MRKIFALILLTLCTLVGSIQAQAQKIVAVDSTGQERPLTRLERKTMQRQIDSLYHSQAMQALADTAYTLEADEVIFKYGQRAFVSSNVNFVAVRGNHAVVQVAFNVPMAGPNGLGGVTVEGLISSYKQETTKRGDTTVSMNVMGLGISAQVNITLYAGSNKADVLIQPNFNSRQLTLSGTLLPTAFSNVFKGMSL